VESMCVWRFFQLEEINRPTARSIPGADWSYGWSMMRIGAT